MQTRAHFSKIKDEIIIQLRTAKNSVKVAVAWLTDDDLIRELTNLLSSQVAVSVVISNSEQNFINPGRFRKFIENDGSLYICKAIFMHHKFCLIDQDRLINGSYNWSYTARGSEENIITYTLDSDAENNFLIPQFNARFEKIFTQESTIVSHYREITSIPMAATSTAVLDAEEARLISVHTRLEQRIQDSIKHSQQLKIQLNYDDLQKRIIRDGGGTNFIRRILREEMSASEMKSGFRKLEEFIPHKVELSLEYLVCLSEFRELFNEQELGFCLKLMRKYHLFQEG